MFKCKSSYEWFNIIIDGNFKSMEATHVENIGRRDPREMNDSNPNVFAGFTGLFYALIKHKFEIFKYLLPIEWRFTTSTDTTFVVINNMFTLPSGSHILHLLSIFGNEYEIREFLNCRAALVLSGQINARGELASSYGMRFGNQPYFLLLRHETIFTNEFLSTRASISWLCSAAGLGKIDYLDYLRYQLVKLKHNLNVSNALYLKSMQKYIISEKSVVKELVSCIKESLIYSYAYLVLDEIFYIAEDYIDLIDVI